MLQELFSKMNPQICVRIPQNLTLEHPVTQEQVRAWLQEVFSVLESESCGYFYKINMCFTKMACEQKNRIAHQSHPTFYTSRSCEQNEILYVK